MQIKKETEGKLATIKAILWDFDGVLYNNEVIPDGNIHRQFRENMAKTAIEFFPDMDFEKATEIGMTSFKKNSSAVPGFIEYCNDNDIEPEQVIDGFFDLWHIRTFRTLNEDYAHLFSADNEHLDNLKSMPDVNHAIISHGSSEYWVKPFLKLLGEDGVFEPENVMGLSDYDYEAKHTGPKAFLMGMSKLGAKPEETIFIDDCLRNVQYAKKTFPEMVCVYKNLSEHDVIPEGVDAVVKDKQDLISSVKLAKAEISCNIKANLINKPKI